MKMQELVEKIAKRTKTKDRRKVYKIIRGYVEETREALHNCDRISLSGLGTFRTKLRKPKPARDIGRKIEIRLPPGIKVCFRPCKSLKDLLKGTHGKQTRSNMKRVFIGREHVGNLVKVA